MLNIFELYYHTEYSFDYKLINTPVLAFASTRDNVVSYTATQTALQKMTNAELKDWSHTQGIHNIISSVFNKEATDMAAVEVSLAFLDRQLTLPPAKR